MAKHVLYEDITSTAKQPYLKQTHQHYNEMFNELSKAFGNTIVADPTGVTILWGCENTGTGTGIGDSAIISEGAVYYNGEIYQVPAFSTASIVNGLKGTFTTGYVSGIDPVLFSDNTSHNVHQIQTLVLSDASASLPADYINWKSIKNEWKTYNLTNSDVASATGTFTVSAASEKLLYYKIDYKNQIVTLNLNIIGANIDAATSAFYIKLPESLNVTNTFVNMGYYINGYLTSTEDSGATKETVTKMYTNGGYGSTWLTIIPSRSASVYFQTNGTNNIYLQGQITFSFGA